jgi:aromatic-L-amino-acid decarboxylase
LIETIAEFFDRIEESPVISGESTKQVQSILGSSPLPKNGSAASSLFSRTTELLLNHSLLNGHPKFFGYITFSPAPIGALTDQLAKPKLCYVAICST